MRTGSRFFSSVSAAVGCLLVLLGGAGVAAIGAQESAPGSMAPPSPPRPPRVMRPGVNLPGISHPLEELKKDAVFPVEGSPDWQVMTADAVWVASARANHVVQLLPAGNTVGLIVDVARPCSGLAEGFGSVWVPSCGTHEVLRLDPATGKPTATIAADAANSEGGIAVGAGSVWFVVKPSTLERIDPATNTVSASVELPSGSENPVFGDGFIWVSSFGHDSLLKVDPTTNKVVATIPTGPKPRFLTVGAGSVWTLNQGDGSVTRVEMKTGKVLATVSCGLAGGGGDITFGDGAVWATVFDVPLTKIDAKTNAVVAQWKGQGGDGMRFGFGSVWLSNLRQGTVWRVPPKQ